MVKRVLRNETTGHEYEVVAIDTERKVITLKGELSEFNEPLDWDRFRAMGYKRATVETEPEAADG